MCDRLKAVMPVDGVFLSLLGAAIGTVDTDPTTVQIFSSAIGIDRAKLFTPNPTVYEQKQWAIERCFVSHRRPQPLQLIWYNRKTSHTAEGLHGAVSDLISRNTSPVRRSTP